jgi:ribosomal protein S18 acetylase RimI-like enzyme
MTIDDYDEAYDLWIHTEGMGISHSDTKSEIEKFLSRNPGFSFVCIEDGKVVGTILCGHDGRRGFIYHVAVQKELRGRKIGQELIRHSLEKLKLDGIMKCHLMVFADNEAGNLFWNHIGWMRRNEIVLYSKDL